MEPERHVRLCCPLIMQSQRIQSKVDYPPYFGHRRPNPGEIIERGSLPSDPKPLKSIMPPKIHEHIPVLSSSAFKKRVLGTRNEMVSVMEEVKPDFAAVGQTQVEPANEGAGASGFALHSVKTFIGMKCMV